MEGFEHCWNSDDIFAMEELPKSITCIGGGYISLELAGILHTLGVKTTVVVRDIALRQTDQDVVDLLI